MATNKKGVNASKRKRLRCSIETILIPILIFFAGILISVNLLVEDVPLHQPTSPHPEPDRPFSQQPDKSPLVEIMKLANVDLTAQEWESLPSWKQVTDRIGDKPRIVGLETCETFRKNVPLKDRYVAPSGMFSTGTNLLQILLNENCVVHRGGRHSHVGWQVNWGKHQSPRFRHVNHIVKTMNNSNIFPIVMVRDPWTWLQSMCRVRYSAHWFHVPFHCPNFIPNHVEREWFHKPKSYVRDYFHRDPWLVDNVMDKANFTLESRVVPVRVRYKNEVAFHDSLAHFWKEWNQEYYDAWDGNSTFPRLMIRLEDLVFFPQHILTTICNCVGGKLSQPLTLKGDTSKKGGENIHGSNKTDLRLAMISHIYTNRTKGMTIEDVQYATNVLKDSIVRQALGYPRNPL